MKALLNTLYVTSPNRYLSLEGENIVISEDQAEVVRLPLHNIEGIVTFGYPGASPALMGACAERQISLCFLSPQGRFLARVRGKVNGNVTLRKQQYRISDDDGKSAALASGFITGKIYNGRWVLERAARDYPLRLDTEKLKEKSKYMAGCIEQVRQSPDTETLRGFEGKAADAYFSVFDDLILQQKDSFFFNTRNRRPPLDNVNALLSFTYSLLTGMCVSALESVGLDPCVGFLHKDRPGRASLALDLMEELRPVLADRFVLSLINKKVVSPQGFTQSENGAVYMDEDTRKLLLKSWQMKKQEMIVHPFLNEKIEWGLVPYVQALLLARHLRGDLDDYPCFLWK